jgi:hypothetical protein
LSGNRFLEFLAQSVRCFGLLVVLVVQNLNELVMVSNNIFVHGFLARKECGALILELLLLLQGFIVVVQLTYQLVLGVVSV